MKRLSLLFTLLLLLSCSKPAEFEPQKAGVFNREYVSRVSGFFEKKTSLLKQNSMTESDFNQLSIIAAADIPIDSRERMIKIRKSITELSEMITLQKTIPLDEVMTYMNNVYGGTVGGFVCVAADVKSMVLQNDIINGLRLDYEGTKFKIDGAGYAVIRFRSSDFAKLTIPFSKEIGGIADGKWPFTGSGFTSSILGCGGYPEWKFDGYYAPDEGAELYEITPKGYEILRSVYTNGYWQTFEATTKSQRPVKSYRSGLYAIYCDKEYKSVYSNGGVKMISTTPQQGFEAVHSDLFVKTVRKDQLESIYTINSVISINGVDYSVFGESGSKFILRGSTQIEGSVQVERGVYQIVIDKDSCNVREVVLK